MPSTNDLLDPSDKGVSRRRFLAVTGVAAATAAAITHSTSSALAQPAAPPPDPAENLPPQTGQPPEPAPAGGSATINALPDTPPAAPLPAIRLQPLTAPTEREEKFAPTAAPPERRIGYAIVGLGRLSLEQILPAFAEAKLCRPVALVSGHREKALQVARQYGMRPDAVYSYDEYDRLRDNREVEAVYIVLPNALHAEHTARAAQAGKHVLCEKPMATSPQECERMIDACRKAGRKLMVAYRIQYEPHHRTLRQMMENRELGKVKLIEASNCQNQGGDLNQWRLRKALAGGGALPDIGLYCLNTLRFVTGEEPVEIQARQFSTPDDPRFREVEETVTWLMRFPTGVEAHCSTSYGVHESRRYRVFGEQGWAEMDPAFSYEGLQMHVGRKSPINPAAESREQRILSAKNQFALEMDHFAACVAGDKTPWTPGEEGLQDHRLMEAIYRSAREGSSIRLPVVGKRDAFRGAPPV